MITNSLFDIKSIESDLESAINSSVFDLQDMEGGAEFWAETVLKRNVEQRMQTYGQNFAAGAKDSTAGLGDPPGSGFKVTFGLQILLDYKIRFKANLNLGYGQRYGDFATTGSLHFSAYNRGLGVGANKRNMVYDVTAAANVIVGGGQGTPLQSYALNYNSPIPMLNDFKNSFSYGQLFTWNSALNENQFSLDRLQREGMIGFRLGNVNVSSNNDTKRIPYFGGGTDMGWTGGISIVTPIVELGFQNFSGDFLKTNETGGKEEEERERLSREIKRLKKDKSLSEIERKMEIDTLESRLKSLTFYKYHNQTDYQKNLNKASTYIRFNQNDGYNGTIDLIGDAWLQNAIHRAIKDFRFEYNHKSIEGWGGKRF